MGETDLGTAWPSQSGPKSGWDPFSRRPPRRHQRNGARTHGLIWKRAASSSGTGRRTQRLTAKFGLIDCFFGKEVSFLR